MTTTKTAKGGDIIASSEDKKEQGIHSGHRLRLRRRFDATGLKGFDEHTALELLLFYALPRQDTNPLAHRLLEHFGSLAAVFSASKEELMQVKGVGENTAILLRLVPQLTQLCREQRQEGKLVLDNSTKAGEYLIQRLYERQTETLLMLCLDAKKQMIACEELGNGNINSISITMREIAQICLRKNVSGIILAHNHPSGLALPSREDIAMTRKVQDVLQKVGVQVYDHFVITEKEFYSMKDHKLF